MKIILVTLISFALLSGTFADGDKENGSPCTKNEQCLSGLCTISAENAQQNNNKNQLKHGTCQEQNCIANGDACPFPEACCGNPGTVDCVGLFPFVPTCCLTNGQINPGNMFRCCSDWSQWSEPDGPLVCSTQP